VKSATGVHNTLPQHIPETIDSAFFFLQTVPDRMAKIDDGTAVIVLSTPSWNDIRLSGFFIHIEWVLGILYGQGLCYVVPPLTRSASTSLSGDGTSTPPGGPTST
jgi:hypothetical protein